VGSVVGGSRMHRCLPWCMRGRTIALPLRSAFSLSLALLPLALVACSEDVGLGSTCREEPCPRVVPVDADADALAPVRDAGAPVIDSSLPIDAAIKPVLDASMPRDTATPPPL